MNEELLAALEVAIRAIVENEIDYAEGHPDSVKITKELMILLKGFWGVSNAAK